MRNEELGMRNVHVRNLSVSVYALLANLAHSSLLIPHS